VKVVPHALLSLLITSHAVAQPTRDARLTVTALDVTGAILPGQISVSHRLSF